MDPIDIDVERLRLELWEANHEMEITRTTNPFIYAEGGVNRNGITASIQTERSPLPSGDKDKE